MLDILKCKAMLVCIVIEILPVNEFALVSVMTNWTLHLPFDDDMYLTPVTMTICNKLTFNRLIKHFKMIQSHISNFRMYKTKRMESIFTKMQVVFVKDASFFAHFVISLH